MGASTVHVDTYIMDALWVGTVRNKNECDQCLLR